MRRKTKQVMVRGVAIGGEAPITVQSMANTDTRDVEATKAQMRALEDAGCDIVRIAVFDKQSAEAVKPLVEASRVPLVADIHFDHRLAVMALENGIDKLRINPGNIGDEQKIAAVCDCLKMHNAPVRVGVNMGSLERDIEREYGRTPRGMVESALRHVRILEKHGVENIVISLKASDVEDMVSAYRQLADICDYPLHLGVTEAGLPGIGEIKSAIGIGSLLLDGIGDTLRVSLTGDPVPEVAAGKNILAALGMQKGLNLISCPTCGRCRVDVAAVAKQVREQVGDIDVPVTAAVMGCVVNGPGEAKAADIGVAGGDGKGALFEGDTVTTIAEDEMVSRLVEGIRRVARERKRDA